jgi:Arginase family
VNGTCWTRLSATPTASRWSPIRLAPAAAARAHVEASAGAIVVPFDVDAVDSADLPLANYPHHGKGLRFDAGHSCVPRWLCASPAFAGLALTEVNPTHDPGGELLGRYIDGVTAAPRRTGAQLVNGATPPRAARTAHSGRPLPARGARRTLRSVTREIG